MKTFSLKDIKTFFKMSCTAVVIVALRANKFMKGLYDHNYKTTVTYIYFLCAYIYIMYLIRQKLPKTLSLSVFQSLSSASVPCTCFSDKNFNSSSFRAIKQPH